jgi:chromosome segregation ATPase
MRPIMADQSGGGRPPVDLEQVRKQIAEILHRSFPDHCDDCHERADAAMAKVGPVLDALTAERGEALAEVQRLQQEATALREQVGGLTLKLSGTEWHRDQAQMQRDRLRLAWESARRGRRQAREAAAWWQGSSAEHLHRVRELGAERERLAAQVAELTRERDEDLVPSLRDALAERGSILTALAITRGMTNPRAMQEVIGRILDGPAGGGGRG